MIRVSFPGFSPTRWQVGEKTGGMGVLRGKFSSIWASFFWGVKNEEFSSWQSWSVQNAVHAWFQNSNKTSKKKKSSWSSSVTGAYKRTAQEKILVTRRDFSANSWLRFGGRPKTSLSIRRFWGKGERWKRKRERGEGFSSPPPPSPIGRPDTQATPKLNLLIQFQYIYDVQCVDLRNRWPIAFYCAMHVVTTERCNLSLVHDKFRFMRKVSGVANSLQG